MTISTAKLLALPILVFALLAGSALPGPAKLPGASASASEGGLVTQMTAEDIVRLMRRSGFQAEIDQTQSGDPVINGSFRGMRFRVFGHTCSGSPARCERLDFSAGFRTDGSVSKERINAFNRTWMFGKSYLSENGNAYIDFPVNMTSGVTEANMENNLRLWSDIMQTFADYIGWKPGS